MNSLLYSRRSGALACTGLLLVVLGMTGLQGQPGSVRLPVPARGANAIEVLGAKLPEVVRAYGLEAHALENLLRLQPSLGVDEEGALFFSCEAPSLDEAAVVGEAMTPTSSVMKLATGGTEDAFRLHSLPGAGRVIYLDFTGHTTSGTQWNSSKSSFTTPPFDTDGSPSTFSASERAIIQAVWQRVAEDYAPFNIDVTTQDPGIEGLRRTSSTDTAYGIRVVIGKNTWYSSGAGGVGYVGSFSWNTDTPVFVFSNALGNSAKYIAECASHEAGHSLGLHHDGGTGTEYYAGHGSWAPIMGNSYYKTLTQFSRGEYSGATNTQDDFAVISSHAPYVSDDHGNSLSTATLLSGTSITDGGTIETRSDVDVFRFATGTGNISLRIASPSPETNLHMKAELLNSAGQVLSTNSLTSLNATFTNYLTAGTYYLRISGIGSGDPRTTGYSDYGSVGNYLITGTVVYTSAVSNQPPIAVASATTTSGVAPLTVGFSAQGSRDNDGTIASYHWNFGNGTTSTAMNPSCTYSSAGTFTAVLTVTDNAGAKATASVTITVTAPTTNQPPVAVVTADRTSGVAPLTVAFNGATSYDPDGYIASYSWNFGDGTTSTAASPIKTFSSAGTYTVRLTVKDNKGATASKTLTVTASAPTGTTTKALDVGQYSLSTVTEPRGTSAVATIVIRDSASKPVPGATVTLRWSGLVTGTVSATTNSAGQVIFVSKHTKSAGSITGAITAVTPPSGYTYSSGLFTVPTSRTVTLTSQNRPAKSSR